MRRRFFSALAVSVGLCASAAEVSVVETRGDVNAAVGRVAAAGGGRVVVPVGDWETPGLVLKSNVELHLAKGARLLFATNLSGFVRIDVPRCEGCTHALVSAVGVTNVAITGEGELVGRGGSWPQPGPHQPHLIRPKGVVFANCRDIRLSDFLLRDSPSWGIVFKCCDGVVARRVRVDSHANANNDGFDIEARNVLLEYCDVDSGDDAYCLKSNDPDFVMENVTVRGCIGRSNCNGFKIGTASHGTVRRVRFENCLTEAPRRSFVSRVDAPSAPKAGEEWFRFNRTREWPGGPEHLAGMAALAVECVDGGEVSDVVCSGLLAYGMMTPIFIRGGERTGRETPAGTKYVLKDIRVEGCVAVAESLVPSSVTGAGRCRPENVLLKNVRIRVKPHRAPCPDAEIPELPDKYPEANMFGLLPAHGLYARHVTGLKLDDVVFEAADDTRPRVRTEDVTDFAERPHPPGKRATDPDLSWRWLGDAKRDARIRAKRVEQLVNAGRDYDAVWLGDSITHRWESEAGQPEFERSFGRYRILNMGFGGDKTQNVLWNILYGKVLDGYRTRIVSLLIGTNNIWQRTPEEIAAGVKLCLEAIRAKQPKAKVLLHAVLPREVAHQRGTRNFRRKNRPNVDEVAPKIRRVNELIRPFTDGKDVLFVDLTARFTDAEGLPDIKLLEDGTHPNAAGYRIWADEVLPIYRTILGERPNLVVGIVSDPHANSSENNRYLRKALEYFRARQVDAVAIPGDFGFVAKHGELLASSRTWFDVFPDDRLPDGRKVERLFITGNHDEDGWRYGKKAKERYADTTPEQSAFAFNRQAFWREAWHEDYEPVFMKTVKGYRFVCRHWLPLQDYAKNPFPAWFAAHRAELPTDRPFFYLQHETLTGATRHPSAGKVVKGRLWDGADDGTAAKLFADFPNCVALTGHLHNPLSFDTGIWQGAFMSVDCGSANAWAFTWAGRENGHPGGREMPMCDVKDQRHCLVMSVYGDRIVFERRCLLNDESLGADWVVPIGPSAPRPYSDVGENSAEVVPQFAPGAKVEVCREMGVDEKGDRHEQIVITFPCVNGTTAPFVRAFDYEIVSPQGKRPYAVFSPNCCLAPGRDVGPVVCRMNAADFPKDALLAFEVRPRDSRGRSGRSITGHLRSSVK